MFGVLGFLYCYLGWTPHKLFPNPSQYSRFLFNVKLTISKAILPLKHSLLNCSSKQPSFCWSKFISAYEQRTVKYTALWRNRKDPVSNLWSKFQSRNHQQRRCYQHLRLDRQTKGHALSQRWQVMDQLQAPGAARNPSRTWSSRALWDWGARTGLQKVLGFLSRDSQAWKEFRDHWLPLSLVYKRETTSWGGD